ncbi:DNA-binding HxlR family transcriptional regulator [Catenuloplanes nepalensis]|uniref:DNA-binding HxlR family transcriptional regulator n=1 Tax=Catenuloplanes nepalensis TaxID=587533 RepID=A0ABT9MXU8_9ACTN|nr:helix-turn-helix domain-containing protein [Catenuloplanes nepalensis]MDP9796269.1 DNA-binding HxlR family transcriptional regulator [Catenuloplanes nepalensis]
MRPDALNWSVENCPIGGAMAVLGEKWTVAVMREVFSGVRRFEDMRVRTGVPRQVLTNRLAMLVEQDLLRREQYQEPGSRRRYEYRLTAKGLDLYPILIALRAWGEQYIAGPEGPSVRAVHRGCDADVHLTVHCADGHELADPRAVALAPGPGAIRLDPS